MTMRSIALLTTGLLLLSIPACQQYKPTPMDQVPFMERAQTETQGGVTVTVVVLGAEESQKVFGRPFADGGIQPVWVKVENNEDTPYALIPRAIDPMYYS